MNVHELIDDFVSVVDPSGNIFRRVYEAPWIDALELTLKLRLPVSFRSLVARYVFLTFDAGGISFFANTGVVSMAELSAAIFKDRIIAEASLRAGYIQFGRPEGGSYDPICFNAARSSSNREFPIVRLDHEEILCNDRIRVSRTVSDSFYRFAGSLTGRS